MKLTHIHHKTFLYEFNDQKILSQEQEVDLLQSWAIYPPLSRSISDYGNSATFLKLSENFSIIKSAKYKILNATKIKLTRETILKLKEEHGKFDIVQIDVCSKGPFPASFKSFSEQQKDQFTVEVIKQNLVYAVQVAKELNAEWLQPVGDYFLGGYMAEKNRWLPVPSRAFAAEYIASQGVKPLLLNEGGSIDLETGELKAAYNKKLKPFVNWYKQIQSTKYTYELREQPDKQELAKKQITALDKLFEGQEKLSYYPNLLVRINGDSHHLANSLHFLQNSPYPDEEIIFTMDDRLLDMIISNEVTWKEAMESCHIEIDGRVIYEDRLAELMSHYHL